MREWTDMILRSIRMLFKMGLYGEFQDISLISGGDRQLLEVLYRSMTAGVIVLVILLLRVLLRRAPKIYCYLLWALVLYRLLCPFTFMSPVSFMGMVERVEAVRGQPVRTSDFSAVLIEGEPQMDQNVMAASDGPAVVQREHVGIWLSQRTRLILRVSVYVWITGMAVMLLYGGLSLLFMKRRLREAVSVRDHIYLSDHIPIPFVMGILRPRIYLPSSLEEKEWDYIILHERTHIRRGDHIIRILSFVALAIYWFHPLIWAAYYLSGKDMEMSCDEAVMRKVSKDIRADYSTSLLQLSTGRWLPDGTPLAFGKQDVKKRIENVMHWHRPKPVVVGAALAVVTAAVVILGTDPRTMQAGNEELKQAAQEWAQAFCDRDGNRIAALCTEEKREKMKREEFLSGEEGNYGFGWSSPWPWDVGNAYRVVECTPQETVILYYAWTSDPHVTVWQESLTWQWEEAGYLVEENSIVFLNDLSDSDSFYMAYRTGIDGTPMDYLTNGAGEDLNNNALQDTEGRYYQKLFAPETAVRMLLNLSEDEEKVIVMAGDIQQDGSVPVSIDFTSQQARVEVKMIQPYGADGIWIPQN